MRIIPLLISLSCLFLSDSAFAVVGGYFTGPAGTIDPGSGPAALIAQIIRYAIGLAGILGVIGVTWGGLQMILATGDDEKFKKSRYMIIFSLIGVSIAGTAYWAVGFISSLRF